MKNWHLLGALMAPATEPTFTTNDDAAQTRVVDYLELAFKPAVAGDPVVFERIALVTDLGGFAPNRTVVRKEAFQDADGVTRSLVAIIDNGGGIQFATSSRGALSDRILAAAVRGDTVLFKAHYVSAGRNVWGKAKINDRGIQGGRGDIPDWGYALEATEAQYVDDQGNKIG